MAEEIETRLARVEADLARLMERTGNQNIQLEKLDARMVKMDGRLEESASVLKEMTGGRKMIFAIFAAAGSFGAIIGALIREFFTANVPQ